MEPLVIEVALNGPTPKARNDAVPRTPQEIVADALACIEAGAAIVHHHNAEGLGEGRHSALPYAEVWRALYSEHPDALLYPTMGGGGVHTSPKERYAHVEELSDAGLLRMALIDPGSLSLGVTDPSGMPVPLDIIYQNTFADVLYMVDVCTQRELAAHVSVFEPGFLRLALLLIDAGRFPPAKLSFYFGGEALPFGLPPTTPSLAAYRSMLAGRDLPWMVAVLGGDVRATLAEEVIRGGGHLRVGLEDYAGARAPTNRQLVAEIVTLADEIGRPVATSAQAAQIFRVPAARAA